jgi:hypothetical protein
MHDPQVGDEFPIEILFPLSEFEKLIAVPTLPQEWTYILKEPLDLTDAITDGRAWIYRIDDRTNTVYLTLSRFGAYPISDRMRPRYNRAARALLGLFAGEPANAESLNAVSEAKGMYNRILRRDQWDWLSVYKALNRPTTLEASQVVQWLIELRAILLDSKIQEAERFLHMGPAQVVRKGLENALMYLEKTYQGLPGGHLVTFNVERKVKVSTRKICSNYDAMKTERASSAHQETLSQLNSLLRAQGYRVESNMYVDAFSRLKTGPAFFEVKSISDENELEQVRGALSQLYEYRFRHRLDGATLWIVLSRPPQLPWLIEYLTRDREVCLLWLENGDLTGPSIDALARAGVNAGTSDE